jgi:hypothetical protein
MARHPTTGSAAEYACIHGIASLRGVALKDGGLTVYVSNREIDRLIKDETDDRRTGDSLCPAWSQKTYGGDSPTANLVVSLNLNTLKLKNPASPHEDPDMNQFNDLLKQHLSDPSVSSAAEEYGDVKAVSRVQNVEGVWRVDCEYEGSDELINQTVDSEELFGWMWKKVKVALAAAPAK